MGKGWVRFAKNSRPRTAFFTMKGIVPMKKKTTKAKFDWKTATASAKRKELKRMLGNTDWHKSGGSADKTIQAYINKLSEHGFKKVKHSSGNAPEGSFVSNSKHFMDKHGNTAVLTIHIGSWRYDNSYSFNAQFKGEAEYERAEARAEFVEWKKKLDAKIADKKKKGTKK